MSAVQHEPTWLQSGTYGAAPAMWFGVDLPDGDRGPWLDVPIGSIYCYKPSETANPRWFVKRAVNARDDDWRALGGIHSIEKRFSYTDFTDGGGASGTLALTETIPVGAKAIGSRLVNLTGFSGDTSAVIIVGDGTDTDRYNTGTPDVFTTANAIDLGVASGTLIHITAATITVTITSGSDWGLVTAGAATLIIDYYF